MDYHDITEKDQLQALCDERGIEYANNTGVKKLQQLLTDHAES